MSAQEKSAKVCRAEEHLGGLGRELAGIESERQAHAQRAAELERERDALQRLVAELKKDHVGAAPFVEAVRGMAGNPTLGEEQALDWLRQLARPWSAT